MAKGRLAEDGFGELLDAAEEGKSAFGKSGSLLRKRSS